MHTAHGFHFEDERGEEIWQRYQDRGEAPNHQDRLALFPGEPARQNRKLQRQDTD